MAPKNKRRSFESSQARRRIVLSVLALVAIGMFIGGMYLLTRMGPRPVVIPDAAAAIRAEAGGSGGAQEQGELAADVLRGEIRALEARFDAESKLEGAGVEVSKVLDDAIALQVRIIGSYPRSLVPKPELDEMDRLLLKRDSYVGNLIFADSRAMENRAKTLLEAEDFDGALKAYDEAIRSQGRINDDFPLSDRKSIARLRGLEKSRDEIQAVPLHREVESLVARAAGDAESGNFITAAEWIGRAIDIQRRINREFRQTSFASQFKLQGLERQQIDYRAGELQNEVDEAIDSGTLADRDERYEDAATAYTRAFNAQKRLNRDFPRSSYASEQKLENFEILRQSAQSRRLVAEITELEAALLEALRGRDGPAIARTVADYYRARQNLRENFPKSRFADEQAFARASYLYRVLEVIPTIQSVVDEGLRPVPGFRDARMYSAEVNQLFFLRVTGNNPASVKGDLLPVESVSWPEAVDFCRQLGWILGRTVRLPTEEEARAALGPEDRLNLSRMVWSSVNSGRSAQTVASVEPNAYGFYDLLGNVGEWLQVDDPTPQGEAFVFGGSARDNPDRLSRIPVLSVEKSERSRFTGFRFVMEITTE